MSQTETDGPLYRRWWKVWPFPRCCLPCNSVLHPCRASVSQNKKRYQKDGFDLDLSYVTGRIIVHGFPATGVEHIYRNPRLEVQRLLDTNHESKYKVYNFASEPGRTYPEQLFHGRVERYPFADHTCPPLESVVDFCENAKAWLDTHEDNVVSLHCKAGKGRAGIMAACLMVRLGDTASAAVSKFDEERVSDFKGLTVVNQRKWPFLYERLVRELWGVQDSIGVVPGQDPDLRAPAVRVACIREISIQLQPKTKGGKKNDKILPSLSCAIFQQEPMGKTLVHRAKMVPSAPEDGYSGSVYAAALPRSAVVQGTFQVLITSALGAAATQKHIIDLWWTTTFLTPEGGDHAFALAEMDVFSRKLATRLQEAGARVILRHTHPHAASPRRRSALKNLPAGSKTANPEEAGDGEDGEGVGSAQGEGTSEQAVPAPSAPAAPAPDNKAGGEPRQEATDPSLAKTAAEKSDNATTTTTDASEGVRDAQEQNGEVDSAAGSSSQTERAAGAETYIATARNSDVATGQKSARAAPVMHKQAPSIGGPSPAFPGPSPAGLVSPVWTFEGRTPSVRDDPAGRAIEDSRWTRSKMWNSNPGVSSGGASTPTAAVSVKSVAPAADRGTGLRAKRRTAQRQRSRSDSIGSSQSGMHSAMSGGSGPVRVGGAWSAVYGGDNGGGESRDKSSSVEGQGQGRQREKGLAFHGHHRHRETDSDSDDQLAVRASAFGRSSTASGGGGGGSGGGGQIAVAQFVPQGPPTGTSSTQGEQWAMEMEMSFAQERRGWEEHRHCLETELDWALAARARAEARSEEDNARVEVLENRLSAWRSEYSMIERDVKHAVKLLEMSLSGLMSAENALKRWKTHIPPKAYEDIMACLTKGEMAHKPAASEQE